MKKRILFLAAAIIVVSIMFIVLFLVSNNENESQTKSKTAIKNSTTTTKISFYSSAPINTADNPHLDPSLGKELEIIGKVTLIDLKPLQTDSSGIINILSNNISYTLYLSPGMSNCDKDAIKIPSLNVGDTASAKVVLEDVNTLVVCDSGTYIR